MRLRPHSIRRRAEQSPIARMHRLSCPQHRLSRPLPSPSRDPVPAPVCGPRPRCRPIASSGILPPPKGEMCPCHYMLRGTAKSLNGILTSDSHDQCQLPSAIVLPTGCASLHAGVKFQQQDDGSEGRPASPPSGEFEYDEETKTMKVPLSASLGSHERRTRLVTFTCNKCGAYLWLGRMASSCGRG